MATSGGNYRNGTHKSSMKVDRSLSLNSNPKPSVKSKSLPSSRPHCNSTGSPCGGAAKDNAEGQFFASLCFLLLAEEFELEILVLGY